VANAITLSRLLWLAIAVVLLYQPSASARIIAAALIVLTIILDGVDGWVARAWDEVSDLGSVLDIAVDRVVEQVLWIVYATLLVTPAWAPIIVVARGVMTDAIRSYVLAKGATAFGMMESAWGQFLVSSRFMRALYGGAKTVVFVYLALLAAAEQDCCRFFGFAITIDQRGIGLDITAPSDAHAALTALFGTPS